jgi:membrane protease YdiL (CAAX protease family)
VNEPEEQATPVESPAPPPNSTSQPTSPPESLPRALFVGPSGLRAGWRLGIYFAAFFALLYFISAVINFVISRPRPHQPPRLWGFLLAECISLAAALLPAFAMSRIERRPFGAYGLPLHDTFGKLFWAGVLWGITAITLLLIVMRGLGAFYFGGFALHGTHVLKFAAFWGVLFLAVALFEEFVTRGYSQFTLAEGIGFWPSAVILSAAFGAIHLGNQGESWVGALGAASIGLFFCLTLKRTGTLWFAVGTHASWNWGETFLYSVPDSGLLAPGHLLNSSFHGSRWLTGGSVGPEGSLLVFVVIALMWFLFDRLYPPKREVVHTTEIQPETNM